MRSKMKGSDILVLMKSLGLNQKKMAELLGVTRQTLNSYLRGRPIPLVVAKYLTLLNTIKDHMPK